ncbi:MAG: hypothetical protein J6Q54_06755, partial [Oscillospiraceae bacterium]|nr:hypothetical protein [Oscillospiraceae bacterium]
KKQNTYYNQLKNLVLGVRAYCENPQLPFLCGGFTDDWSKDYREHCDAIISALNQVCEAVGYAAYTDTTGLLSNNQQTGNGDAIHFCKDAVYKIGCRYFEKFCRIVNGD